MEPANLASFLDSIEYCVYVYVFGVRCPAIHPFHSELAVYKWIMGGFLRYPGERFFTGEVVGVGMEWWFGFD